MACILMPWCNFMHRHFRCLLPEETIDMEVKVKTMTDVHTSRRDCPTQIISYKPWSPRLHPYLSLVRRMQTSLELKGKDSSQLCPVPTKPSDPLDYRRHQSLKRPKTEGRRRGARCPLGKSLM